MCKASLLHNIGTFSTFHVEKPTVLLSLSNVKEWGMKRQRLQRLQKKTNIMVSKAITAMVLKRKEREEYM
jgi:hypothetical protein